MDILTQKDIDALILGTTAEGLGAAVVPYNFARPPRIPRERQVILETIYTRLSTAVASLLSNTLSQDTEAAFSSVELVGYNEFLMSLGTPCASFLFELGDRVESQAIIDLDARFALYLVDRMFGGLGEGGDDGRALTALEQTVLGNLARRIGELLRDAWGEHLALTPALRSFECGTESLRIAGPDDVVLVATLVVHAGSGAGNIAVCLPVPAIETFLQERSGPVARSARGKGDGDVAGRQAITQQILSASIPVVARLQAFRLPAMDVAAFQVGQLLSTGQSTQGAVELLINGRRLFRGTLGQHQGKVGLRITEAVDQTATAPRLLTRRTDHQ